MACLAAEEHLIFLKLRAVRFDWSAWEDRRALPIGAAAFFAWLCGWAGAIVRMEQVLWQSPLALKVGGYGGDIGMWLSIGFASLVFPPVEISGDEGCARDG